MVQFIDRELGQSNAFFALSYVNTFQLFYLLITRYVRSLEFKPLIEFHATLAEATIQMCFKEKKKVQLTTL